MHRGAHLSRRARGSLGRHTGTGRYAALLTLAVPLLGAAVGCSNPGAAPVAVTLPTGAASPSCQSLSGLWPSTVGSLKPRPVSVDSPAARAWGDPAVVAICGYEPPGPSTLECVAVDGVDWIIQRRSDGVQFTTYGRSPAMDVLIPAAYAPEPLLLPAFSAAARSLPETGRHCQ